MDGWMDGQMERIWLWNSPLLLPAVLILVMMKKLALSSVETLIHINVFQIMDRADPNMGTKNKGCTNKYWERTHCFLKTDSQISFCMPFASC